MVFNFPRRQTLNLKEQFLLFFVEWFSALFKRDLNQPEPFELLIVVCVLPITSSSSLVSQKKSLFSELSLDIKALKDALIRKLFEI